MKNILIGAVASVGMLAASAAIADSGDMVLATSQNMKGGSQRIALDLIAAKGFAGFEFELAIPANSKVSTKSCVQDIAKRMNATCVQMKNGNVKAFVFMTEAGELPAGSYKIGFVDIAGASAANIKPMKVMFANGAAEERSGSGVNAK